MDIAAIICRGFLNLTNHAFVFPFLIVLFYAYSSAITERVIIIFLFSMLLNAILKYHFYIPLPAHLGPGWAFPSGHMHAAMGLWGWLAWEIHHKWFYTLTAFILTGIGIGLIYFGYHSLMDVTGAVLFCLLMFSVYDYLLAKNPLPKASLGIVFCALGAAIIYVVPLTFSHLWLACGALLGFSVGRLCYPQNFETYPTAHKALLIGSAFITTFGLVTLSPLLGIAKIYQSLITYFLITLSVTLIIPQLLNCLPMQKTDNQYSN